MHEKYVKRTMWVAKCPMEECTFEDQRVEKAPKSVQCPDHRVWCSFEEISALAPEIEGAK